jgi:hypothetical protein
LFFEKHRDRRLSPVLRGEQFEIAIEKTEGFSFAQLRETYILGAQTSFECGRGITAGNIVEATERLVQGAYDLKTSIAAPGCNLLQAVIVRGGSRRRVLRMRVHNI